jgi:hypothetical protein
MFLGALVCTEDCTQDAKLQASMGDKTQTFLHTWKLQCTAFCAIWSCLPGWDAGARRCPLLRPAERSPLCCAGAAAPHREDTDLIPQPAEEGGRRGVMVSECWQLLHGTSHNLHAA